MKILLCSALPLVASLVMALPGLAQPAQPAPPAPAADATAAPPIFGEEIDVRVVNVEAVVTDRAGHRVTDLKPGDFRLKVDGKEVPVSFFTEVRDGRAVAVPGGDGATAAAPSAAPGAPVGTSYLVFVDEYFATVVQRNQVLLALKKDLARLGPGDRMAVVAFDGARLARLSGWTGSGVELGRVLDQAAARPARGLDRVSERRSFQESQDLSELVRTPGPEKLSAGSTTTVQQELNDRIANTGLSLQERAYGGTLVRQVRAAVAAAVSAMRGSGAPSGRKVMLLLSGGWPFSVQGFLRGADTVPTSSRDLPGGEEILRPLTLTANLLGFTLYPVDVPGIETDAADATSFDPQRPGSNLREQEIEGSLSFIAAETGGRALLNSARLEALPTAVADVRSYYWLGFTPNWERNDHRHKVEVAVLRPDLAVRSRNSFLDLSHKAEVGLRLESALLFGRLPDAVEMPMRLGVPASVKGLTEIPVTLGLPVEAMTVVPVDGRFRSHLELHAAAGDDNGNRSDVPVLPLDLTAAKVPKAGGFVRYDTKIKIRGKAKHLVVAVYDPLSGKIATA